ncbi:MAG: PAS domain-containing protein [bacterium]|nr:PAS domain-containing protein [bacterium]
MGDILVYYEKLVDFLAEMLGEECEVVLQDCRKRCIVAIANGHISGRKVGAPLTNYGLNVIAEGKWKTKDWDINYQGKTANGKQLVCSTFFIKEKNELVGMLCFNRDPSMFVKLSEEILRMGKVAWPLEALPDSSSRAIESFVGSVPEMIYEAAKEVFGALHYVKLDHLNQEERLRLLENLENKGAFQLKGAVSETAQHLGCSEASMYRYLSKIAKKKKEGLV